MIEVKHRPATALPFRLFLFTLTSGTTIEVSGPPPMKLGERPCIVGWSGFDSNDLDSATNVQNAEYLVHAANAYPKFVAALRRSISCTVESSIRAERLLRDLGEGT